MSELQMKTKNLEIYYEFPLYIFSSRDLSDSRQALWPFLIELTGDRIWKINFLQVFGSVYVKHCPLAKIHSICALFWDTNLLILFPVPSLSV